MRTNFKFIGIEENYNHLFGLSEKELAKQNAVKMIVDKKHSYPCRVSLEDAEIGEEVILFPFHHHKTTSPYQSTGPIFIRKNAVKAELGVNEMVIQLAVKI